MDWKIPLTDLDFGPEEADAVRRVVERRWLTAGPEVEAFERELAERLGRGQLAMVSSGMAALQIGLRMLNVGPGDEVLAPALTFVATANAALHAGARVVLCDIVSPEDPTLDPDDATAKCSSATAAAIPVHYAGFACDMDGLRNALAERAARLGVPPPGILEDNAHGIGARTNAGALGTLADAGAFSFFSNKNLSVGEGGALWLPDEERAVRARRLRGQALTRPTWERHQERPGDYDAMELGYNFRPTELAAALGRVQLRKLESMNERRRAIRRAYVEALLDVAEIVIPFAADQRSQPPSCHIFPLLAPTAEAAGEIRDALARSGVQTSHHYTPVHQLTFYRRRLAGAPPRLPRTEEFAAREVTLPMSSTMTEDQAACVAEVVREAVARR